jgi:hypothetical protein
MSKRRSIWGATLAAAIYAGSLMAAELAPFSTDGCSLFPDGTPGRSELWRKCCVAHDKAYWRGGTDEERKAADLALKKCVADLGEPQVGELMFNGVRVGGAPYLPTAFRWGYGWPYPRGYRALTKEEEAQVESMLRPLETK